MLHRALLQCRVQWAFLVVSIHAENKSKLCGMGYPAMCRRFCLSNQAASGPWTEAPVLINQDGEKDRNAKGIVGEDGHHHAGSDGDAAGFRSFFSSSATDRGHLCGDGGEISIRNSRNSAAPRAEVENDAAAADSSDSYDDAFDESDNTDTEQREGGPPGCLTPSASSALAPPTCLGLHPDARALAPKNTPTESLTDGKDNAQPSASPGTEGTAKGGGLPANGGVESLTINDACKPLPVVVGTRDVLPMSDTADQRPTDSLSNLLPTADAGSPPSPEAPPVAPTANALLDTKTVAKKNGVDGESEPGPKRLPFTSSPGTTDDNMCEQASDNLSVEKGQGCGRYGGGGRGAAGRGRQAPPVSARR